MELAWTHTKKKRQTRSSLHHEITKKEEEFRFSIFKTVCIQLGRLRKTNIDPLLFLNGMPIPVVEKTKFLGLIFDRKLSFMPYLHYLKENVQKL